ncbi:MAG: PASTA domain-containing protein [Thermoleophilia bacterium]
MGASAAAAAPTATQLVSQLTCRLLLPASIPLPTNAGFTERRARLAVVADGSVDPAIAFLAGHNVGAPNSADQNVALGLLRRWRISARAALRGDREGRPRSGRAAPAGARGRVSLTLAASAGRQCPFSGFALGTPGARQSLALAFERARLTPTAQRALLGREVSRLRVSIASMPPSTDDAVLATATSLADALFARGRLSDRPAAERAAVAVAVGTQPFLLRLLTVEGSHAVAIDTPPPGLVRVPDVRSRSVGDAYVTLRTAGLHLVIPVPWTHSSLSSVGSVSVQEPAPKTLMPRGARVVVSLGASVAGSPGVPTPIPTATVPALTGAPIADAQAAVEHLGLFQSTTFAPLTAATDATDLLGNYRVRAQDPAAGTVQALGVIAGGGFRPTPVHLWATLRK